MGRAMQIEIWYAVLIQMNGHGAPYGDVSNHPQRDGRFRRNLLLIKCSRFQATPGATLAGPARGWARRAKPTHSSPPPGMAEGQLGGSLHRRKEAATPAGRKARERPAVSSHHGSRNRRFRSLHNPGNTYPCGWRFHRTSRNPARAAFLQAGTRASARPPSEPRSRSKPTATWPANVARTVTDRAKQPGQAESPMPYLPCGRKKSARGGMPGADFGERFA